MIVPLSRVVFGGLSYGNGVSPSQVYRLFCCLPNCLRHFLAQLVLLQIGDVKGVGYCDSNLHVVHIFQARRLGDVGRTHI
jgi:hypothetical protein